MRLTDRSMPFTLPGYPDFLAGLLRARGVDNAEAAERFLHPDLSHLSDPTLLHGIPEAVGVIRRAVRSNARIAVYGDYDADGVCASAILLTALRGMGADAFSYIPDRVTEGYGLHAEAIRHLAGTAGLVVTVDCGVTAREEAALARELGLSLVITDHHTVPDMLPDADAVVHPAMGEHPEPGLCGAGVAWKLALALAGEEAALPLLELAALATVADLVPLLGENRVIAALGLRMMRDTARPGLRALKAVAGIKEGAPVTGEMAGYQLAPRLNAGGRLASAQLALDLLMAPDEMTARPLAARLDMLNRERRDVEAAVLREAQAQIEGRDLTLTRTLVACGEGWNPGVVGLVAGRLAQRWNYPCVVLSQEGDVMHGSGRSAGDVDLHAALSECADLFHRFGGHRMAAGLSMPSSSLEAFRARFDAAVRGQLGDGDLVPEVAHDGEVDIRDVSLGSADTLALLEPFGMGNPAPRFLLRGVSVVSSRTVGSGGAHLKATFGKDGVRKEGIAFGMGGMRLGGGAADIVAGIARNEYNGYVGAQLAVKAILPGDPAFAPDAVAEARSALTELSRQGGDAEAPEQIASLPPLNGHRGTLFACRCAGTANMLRRAVPDLMVFTQCADDPRGFHALCLYPDWDAAHARFDTVVLADGALHPGEAARAKAATGAARVLAMPRNPALTEMLGASRAGVDELRDAWRALRDGMDLSLQMPPGKALACRMILGEMGLARLDGNGAFVSMLPASGAQPEASALYRALNEL